MKQRDYAGDVLARFLNELIRSLHIPGFIDWLDKLLRRWL